MDFRTIVDIPKAAWQIEPCERMLFVGSCFADNIGRRFQEEKFRAVVNPYGVMYNPASILHTVERLMANTNNQSTDGDRQHTDNDSGIPTMLFKEDEPGTAVFTLGTNHVYILKETGEIVDNCRKRPQNLFQEKELSVGECADYLREAISLIHSRYPMVRFILTVSPIRYRKYGYHGSRLSKATLMLAIASLNDKAERIKDKAATDRQPPCPKPCMDGIRCEYFPSYEIMDDELRDYRFYKPDMLHPTDQAVEYIYERMADTFFSDDTRRFLQEWKPIREALAHRPFHPESAEYKAFMEHTAERLNALKAKYPYMPED